MRGWESIERIINLLFLRDMLPNIMSSANFNYKTLVFAITEFLSYLARKNEARS